MKSASIPSIRVQPALREQLEAALHDNETLSEFVAAAIRQAVRQRQQQAEFVARGLRSLEEARAGNDYVDADTVLRSLDVDRTGYVALFSIDGPDQVTVAAVRHQREDDYH